MNKTARALTTFAVLFLLISCNPSPTPEPTPEAQPISNEAASKLANEILTRQKQETFSLPNKFSIQQNTKQEIDCNLKSNDVVYKIVINSENECDLDNLIYRTYRKKTYEVPSVGSSEKETISFYEESKNLLYTVNIVNKVKSITSTSMNKEEAIKTITKFRDSYKLDMCETSMHILSNFDSNLESYKTFYEKMKDKKDEYFKYSFKSSGTKSLQHSNEIKIKHESTYGEDKMNGYIDASISYAINDDLLNSISSGANFDIKTNDGVYYNKQTIENITSYNYIDVKIDKPIIE